MSVYRVQRVFSKKRYYDEDDLEEYKNNRGHGRAIATGALIGGLVPGPIGGEVGRYKGFKAAVKEDRRGRSKRDVIRKATLEGAKYGALTTGLSTAGLAALTKLKPSTKIAITAMNTLGGAAAGALGARKTTQEALEDRDDDRYYRSKRKRGR